MKKWLAIFRWRRIRLSTKLILVYMPLIILPALLGIYLVTQSYTSSSKEMTTKYATDLLSLMAQKIDDRMRSYEQLSKQVISDEELLAVIGKKADSTFEKYQIQSAINEKINVLWLGVDQNKFIRSVKINTPNGIYSYGHSAVDDYDINNSQYRETIHKMNGSTIWFVPQKYTDGYRNFNGLRMGRTIRDKTLNELGEMTVVVDEQAITSIFAQSQFQEDVVLRLLTADGQTILDNGKKLDETEKNILAYSQESIHTGWKLSAQLPLAKLYQPIYQTIQFSIIMVLICVVLGLLVTQIIAMDLVNPVRKLIVNMKHGLKGVKPGELKHFKGAIEIVEINETFISIMYEIEQLIKQLVKQEKKKKDAEIRVLQNQLSPHFLYNTLNSIRWMAMIQKQDNIKEMVDSLNQLLNYSVRGIGEPVPLEEEIAILKNYVNIQKVRYQNFSLIIDLEPGVEQTPILKFLLQPFIENALIHGLVNTDLPGTIQIEGRKVKETIHITVSDNGVGMSPERLEKVTLSLYGKDPTGEHFGLRSVHERIQLHYGEAFGVRIESEAEVGTKVFIRLPVRPATEQEEG